jgi:hypothetical protein
VDAGRNARYGTAEETQLVVGAKQLRIGRGIVQDAVRVLLQAADALRQRTRDDAYGDEGAGQRDGRRQPDAPTGQERHGGPGGVRGAGRHQQGGKDQNERNDPDDAPRQRAKDRATHLLVLV